ncbi:hypothetical protein TrLO_g9739 [Triparma laevis f. longispina]|uniref:Alpha-galactosidase n=1 Tax=Triparma laevis f. longispina TaxID=1714387 RepID=A0A9W7AKM2_9STRA|nr:hypothetical protein TrLO_g9739 [Triparma laevis f. longispina]
MNSLPSLLLPLFLLGLASAVDLDLKINPDHSLTLTSSLYTIPHLCSEFNYATSNSEPLTYNTCTSHKDYYKPRVHTVKSKNQTHIVHIPKDAEVGPTIRQTFQDYGEYFAFQVDVDALVPFKSNLIKAITDGELIIKGTSNSEPKTILIPFDNDIISMYQSRNLDSNADNLLKMTSSYVSPFYNEQTREGAVIGSLEHTVWKTGLEFHAKTFRLEDNNYGVHKLDVLAGLNSLEETRDYIEHGWVNSQQAHHDDKANYLASPPFFMGEFEDWRDGMEVYGRSQVRKGLEMPEGVDNVVGWNSWGVTQFGTNLENAVAASEAMKELEDVGFANSFIDFDAVNIGFDEQAKLVETTDQNGQNTGVYAAPWSYFSDDLDATVSCGGETYTQFSLVKKNLKGEPMKALDKRINIPGENNYAYDPTHPGVLCMALDYVNSALDSGMKLIKIDFINWGCMEGGSNSDGSHYEKSVTTGMAAYNYGMEKIAEAIDNRMVISLSMAPTFPNHFAHARRIGCDQMYGGVEFTMNQLWGGWWQKEMVKLDPDLIVFNKNEIIDVPNFLKPFVNSFKMDARSRVNKGVVHGGFYLAGDDMTNSTSVELTQKYFGNKEVNKVALLGESFRAVSSPERIVIAPNVFELASETGGKYLAVFNYNPKQKSIRVDLAKTVINGAKSYVDLWSGKGYDLVFVDESTVEFDLRGASSMLLQFE